MSVQSIHIPGWKDIEIDTLIFDFNGTLAEDGILREPTKEALKLLASLYSIHILTSDTYGSVVEECKDLPAVIHRLNSKNHSQEKEDYVKHRFNGKVAAIGNGANDELMLEAADLSIAVLGGEGCSPRTLFRAHIVVKTIEEAIGLLSHPQRLVATLRR